MRVCEQPPVHSSPVRCVLDVGLMHVSIFVMRSQVVPGH